MSANIHFDKFTALDFSKPMLNIHPNSPKVEKLHFDFNSREDFRKLSKYDLVISSSALQWSSNLDMTLHQISKLSSNFHFSIFTSNTFSELHRVAQTSSPIYSPNILKRSIQKYFNPTFETANYKLKFSNIYEMLRYIKRSGVSGGRGELGYKDIKNIIANYPLKYLEFEVLFVEATSIER
jgi:malonyl-CoA O-methyltransferase